jgi:hypothetical protein
MNITRNEFIIFFRDFSLPFALNEVIIITGEDCDFGTVGQTKAGHTLMLKTASINHAVQSSKDGQIIFWVDTDVLISQTTGFEFMM